MAKRLVLETYSPAEAEEITGVSTTLQRDWRRRGLLKPTNPGTHTRYTPGELAELVLMNDFARMDLGPKAMRDLLSVSRLPLDDWIAVLQAMEDRRAVGESIVELIDKFQDEFPHKFAVIYGGHEIEVRRMNDLRFAALDRAEDNRIFTVIDLSAVAEMVRIRLPRPLWRIEES